jgi:hypothetical protein
MKQCNPKPNQNNLPEELFDSLKIVIKQNQYGDTIYAAQTRVIEAQANELKAMARTLAKRDTALKILADAITKNTQNATYYNSVTNVTAVTDTVYAERDSLGYPTYEAYMVDRWYKASMRMGRDKAELKLKFDNPFLVQHKYVKDGLLKKKLVVEVQPLNPYSQITEVRSYTVPKQKHQFALSATGDINNLYIGAGVEAMYTYKSVGARLKAGYTTLGPYYGIGLHYNILKN